MDERDTTAPNIATALDVCLGEAEQMLADGNRSGALAQARWAVANHPSDARSHRMLSDVLTHKDLYRHESELCRQLVEDGSIAEALACSRMAMRLPNSSYEDFLQAGYCLTALGKFDEATEIIRTATDMFSAQEQPGLFATISENWEALAPKFLIIGVKKGGTTSLHSYLSRHPLVLPPVVKEMDYFAYPERGFDWYLAHFPRRPSWEKRFITGEGHVGKFSRRDFPPLVKKQLPGVKLIAVLRDPAKRALSDYYHDKRAGMEHRSLEQAIDQELAYLDCPDDRLVENLKAYWKTQRGYVVLGLYWRHLESWLSVFPPKDLLVVISEELKSEPEREMRRVYRHLGLRFHPLVDYGTEHTGQYDDQPKDRVLAKLASFFSKHNERLYEILGRRLKWPRGAEWSYDGPLAVQASEARVAGLKGQWADASRLWQESLAAFPQHPDHVSWLEAATDAARRSGRLADAAAVLQDLHKSDPGSAIALSGLAELAQARRDWMEARRYWDECLAKFPHHPDRERWLNADIRALTELGDWDAAEAVYGALDQERPGSPVGPAGLARCAARRMDHSRAIQLWQDCLRRFPNDADRGLWQRERAHALLESGELAEAAAALEALGGIPERAGEAAGLMAQLAQRARQASDLVLAERVIGSCIARFPGHADRRWWLAMQGDLLLDLQAAERARDVFATLAETYPDSPEGYSGLARAAQRLGDTAAAVAAMRDCLSRFPDHAERRWWLPFYGNALCSIGDWDAAETAFAQMVELDGEDPAGHSGLARVLAHRQGVAAEAQSRAARALLESGELAEAAAALEALGGIPERAGEAAGLMAQLAQRARQASDLVLAERVIGSCIARFPGHADRRWWLAMQGDLLLDLQAAERARDVFATLAETYPDSPEGYSGLARAAQRLGDTAAAVAAMRDCLSRFPDHAERRWWLPFYGNALCSIGDWDAAETAFAQMVELDGEDPAGHSGLARVLAHRQGVAAEAQSRAARALLESGELAEAAAALEALGGIPERAGEAAGLMAQLAQRARQASDLVLAERVIGSCIARFPGHADRRWWLAMQGDLLLDLQAAERARDVFATLAETYPDSPEGYSGLARAAQRLGDTAAAVAAMRDCLSRFPDHAERRWWLPFYGNALCSIGDWDAAETAFTQMVELDGEDPAGHSGLARVLAHRQGVAAEAQSRAARALLESGELAEAAAALEALGGIPERAGEAAGLMAQLAQRARQASDLVLAERVIGSCIARFPGHADRRWWLAMQGDLLLDLQAAERARDVFATLAETYPDSPEGYSGLARAAQRLGDTAAAVAAMRDCLSRFPDHAERRWWLPFYGNALCSIGDWDAAETAFAQAVTLHDEDPAGHSGLARVAVHRQDWPQAAKLLRACVARFPDYQDMSWWGGQLQDAEQRLAQAD